MGTRSVTTFTEKYDDKEEYPLVAIYQQYDGYISGVGHDIARWLLGKRIINGIGLGDSDGTTANGAGCLAAQFIKEHKLDVGGLYITGIGHTEDYNYNIIVDESKVGKANDVMKIVVTEFDSSEPIFIGTPQELLDFEEGES